VEIVAAAKGPHWLARLLGSLLPMVLLLTFFWWMGRRAMNQQQSIFGMGKSQARFKPVNALAQDELVRLLGPRPAATSAQSPLELPLDSGAPPEQSDTDGSLTDQAGEPP
jgi:hypothetical protein